MKKNKKINKNFVCPAKLERSGGFSLLELVLAVAVFSLGSVAMATLLIDSNISTKLGMERTEALFFAKEGMGAVRSIRSDADGWAALTNGPHGLSNTDGWLFTGTSDLINNKYTRVVNISDNATASSTKDVSVTVSWNLTPGKISSVVLNTILTNWGKITTGPAVAPAFGLVSFWSFDDAGSGTALDPISGNTGTVNGATATTSVKGIAANAYAFDGSSYVGATFILPRSTSTISFWLRSSRNDQGILQFDRDGRLDGGYTDRSFFVNSGGGITLYVFDGVGGAQTMIDGGDVSDGLWHMVTGVWDSSGKYLYIDGALIANNDTGIGPADDMSLFTIGGAVAYGPYDPTYHYFNGAIDQVRIYGRALSADEVTTLFNAEKL